MVWFGSRDSELKAVEVERVVGGRVATSLGVYNKYRKLRMLIKVVI